MFNSEDMLEWENPSIHYIIMNEIAKYSFSHFQIGNQVHLVFSEDMFRFCLRCSQYISFHREEIDALNAMSVQEGLDQLEEIIVVATKNNVHEILAWTDSYISMKNQNVDLSSTHMTILLKEYLGEKYPNPDDDMNTFIVYMFQFYQSVDLVYKLDKYQDALEKMRSLFSDEEKESYQPVINKINATLRGKIFS